MGFYITVSTTCILVLLSMLSYLLRKKIIMSFMKFAIIRNDLLCFDRNLMQLRPYFVAAEMGKRIDEQRPLNEELEQEIVQPDSNQVESPSARASERSRLNASSQSEASRESEVRLSDNSKHSEAGENDSENKEDKEDAPKHSENKEGESNKREDTESEVRVSDNEDDEGESSSDSEGGVDYGGIKINVGDDQTLGIPKDLEDFKKIQRDHEDKRNFQKIVDNTVLELNHCLPTLKDYDELSIREQREFDKRDFSRYFVDNAFRNNIYLYSLFYMSLTSPYHMRILILLANLAWQMFINAQMLFQTRIRNRADYTEEDVFL